MVVVNNPMQDVSCPTDQYQIFVTVEGDGEVVASRLLPNFTNIEVDFSSLPKGLYNCTSSVLMDDVAIESSTILCRSRGSKYCYLVIILTNRSGKQWSRNEKNGGGGGCLL